MSNWRVDTPYDMEEPPEILEIRAIIKIVDTRNLSDEESEKQYNDWWCGEKDDNFLTNMLFGFVEELMSKKEYEEFSIWCLKANDCDMLNYIEDFINKRERKY